MPLVIRLIMLAGILMGIVLALYFRAGTHVAARFDETDASTPSSHALAEDPISDTLPSAPASSRPAWVDAPNRLEGKGVYHTTARSGLFATLLECQRELDRAMQDAVNEYVETYLGLDAAALVHVEPEYIRSHIQRDLYQETAQASFGPMQQVHALLEFDDHARAEFKSRWREAMVRQRLAYLGSGTLAVLSLLGTLFGYLKLDQLTGGSHRRRLQFVAAAVILTVVAGTALIQTQGWSVKY